MGPEEIGSVMATDSISDHVAEMSICSESMFKTPNGVDPFYSCGWDPLVSVDQTGNYLGNSSLVHQNEFANPHYPVMLENQTMGNSSHLVPFTSDSSSVDIVQKIPSFGTGSFSEVASYKHCQNSEDGALEALLNGKRKRKNVEVDQQLDQTLDTFEFPKEEENKNIGANSCIKQGAKQAKANSNGAWPSKDNYILVRAKRGQATNSHSLAERVRREKISERMKLLQELVPGCNKITGKAVMLDEIINYVQSLQKQVEFLSMKLATVNPELNVDIEWLLSKDLLPQVGNARPGIGPRLSSSHAFPGIPHGTINGCPGTAQPFHPLPPNLWNNELQSILQTGFNSNPSLNNLGANGLTKMEEL